MLRRSRIERCRISGGDWVERQPCGRRLPLEPQASTRVFGISFAADLSDGPVFVT